MTKMNKIAAGLAASLLLVSAAQAQETVSSVATATVQNAFTLDETAAISFGTVRATADPAGTVQASIIIPANPTIDPSTPASGVAAAVMQILVPGTPGEYAVSGVAPFTSLTLTVPTGDINLTGASAPPSAPKLIADNWSGYILTGPNANTAYAASNLQTDAAGEVTFAVGATLNTDDAASTTAYIDAVYSGNYDIVVEY